MKKLVVLIAAVSLTLGGTTFAVSTATAAKKHAKKKVRRGPRGPKGDTGDPGPAGAPGAPGGATRVYAALAPDAGATTIDTHSGGVLSASCPTGPSATLQEISTGDAISLIEGSMVYGVGGSTVTHVAYADPEGAKILNAGQGGTATAGFLAVTLVGGTVDGGNGVNTSYLLAINNGGAPDSPPAGCLIAGTKQAG